MPLYEYQCDACGQRFEVIQNSFSDPPPDACAACGKGPVHRQFSSPAIQFKGSGWYITDYAQKGKTDGSTPAEGKSDGAESKSEALPAKTETKSDTKTEASKTEAPKT